MPKTNTQIFLEFRDKLINAIVSDPAYQLAKASGNFEDYIKSAESFNLNELQFVQKGTNYTTAIDKGRRPNASNSGGLRQSIYEWLVYKKYGLEWNTEQERRSLSYAISINMAKKGSFKFRDTSKRTKIIENSVEKTLPELLSELSSNSLEKFGTRITKLYGNINK